MAESIGIADVGKHTVAGTWKALDADSKTAFRFLTWRVDSGMSDIRWGVKDVNGDFKEGPHLQADESWSLGPNAGTIRPSESVYIKGTAGDVIHYGGTKV